MKNKRTFLGIICILAAIAIAFGLVPMVSKLTAGQATIIRVAKPIAKGVLIEGDMLEQVTIGAYNLPENIIKVENDVVGKYAKVDMVEGDYMLPSKVSATIDNTDYSLRNLDEGYVAMSITINSFAAGLSGKLQKGDIVSMVIINTDAEAGIIPLELTYVEILAATTSEGVDVNNAEDEETVPDTVTVMVTPLQATLLVNHEENKSIHAVLVYRGDDSDKYIAMQQDMLTGEAVIDE